MGQQYPTFIIDRSRRAEASRFSDDFIVCPDTEVGFIARVYTVPKSRRDEFCDRTRPAVNKTDNHNIARDQY